MSPSPFTPSSPAPSCSLASSALPQLGWPWQCCSRQPHSGIEQRKVCVSSRAPSTLAAPSPFHAGLTWDSGASLSLLINGVKLLNEIYFILPFLQQQRHCSEQPWDVLLHARGGSAVRARTRIRRSQGWTRAWNSQDCWDCPGQHAELTHIGNLLLQQADDPLLASHHLHVEVDHGSATTGRTRRWQPGQEAGGRCAPGSRLGCRALE